MSAPADLRLPPLPAAAHGAAVLVGFSGGLDSTVLLHLLARDAGQHGRGLRALHVHHGLQAGADAWAAHCATVCDALGVPLQVVRVHVDAGSGLGPEGAARAARHRAFADALGPGELLALAHHQDDQAETFLLRALRASGVDGLGSMRALRGFGRGLLWRPLLDIPRARLHAFATEAGLHWREDPSNASDDADRNYLRLQVLPLLRARWPDAGAALARSAALAADAATLLAPGDAAALQAAAGACPRTLAVDVLRALPGPRRARVLRRWIADAGLPPLPANGIARIEGDLLAVRTADGRQPVFAWHGARVWRWRQLLHAAADVAALAQDFHGQWDGREALPLPTGDALELVPGSAGPGGHAGHDPAALVMAAPPWTVGARQGGERIRLPGRAHSHALKHVLQDLGIPPWKRMRLPLLTGADGNVLAAGDAIVSASFDAWLRRNGWRLAWHQAPVDATATAPDAFAHGDRAGLS